jgi:hypothetical protein
MLRNTFLGHPDRGSKDLGHAQLAGAEFGDGLEPSSGGAGDGDGIEVCEGDLNSASAWD